MSEIEPDRCPFCAKWGQEAQMVPSAEAAKWAVICHPCGARGPVADTADLATQLWNDRPDPQRYAIGLVAEEAGEILQLLGKALRFGLDAPGPDGHTARQMIPVEAGDLSAAMHFAELAQVWDSEDAASRLQIKLRRLLDPESVDAQGKRLAPDLGWRGAAMLTRMTSPISE